jgi:uncharacterized SAM-dependent methyltransferase
MKVFKNIEISRLYGVSPTSVANWLENAVNKRNNLEITEINSRHFILDTASNRTQMVKLVTIGRKHKSKDLYKTINPSQEFYKIFGSEQVADIVNNLILYKEIPNKYNYWGKGADNWRDFVDRCISQKVKNIVNDTPEMLDNALNYIVEQVEENEEINIVDIGIGTVHHLKSFIKKLKNVRKINKYIGVDLSTAMIDLADKNLKSWFGNTLVTEFHNLDFTRSSIQETLFYNSQTKDSKRNIVFLLGGTLQNEREYIEALLSLKNSLGENDILVLGHTLDTPEAKHDFELSINRDSDSFEKIPELEKWIPEIIGLTDNFYEVETYYDDQAKSRFMKLVCTHDIEINFETDKFQKSLFLKKGSKITTWRHAHHSAEEVLAILSNLDLFTKFLVASNDNMHLLTVSTKKYYDL